jgi:hypothetical protein
MYVLTETLTRANLVLMGLFVALMTVLFAVPGFTQGLGSEAQSAATDGVTKAALVAGVVIGFAILYKLIRKVTG